MRRHPEQEARVLDREVVVLMVTRESQDSWSGQRLDAPGPRYTGLSREAVEKQIHDTWTISDFASTL